VRKRRVILVVVEIDVRGLSVVAASVSRRSSMLEIMGGL